MHAKVVVSISEKDHDEQSHQLGIIPVLSLGRYQFL